MRLDPRPLPWARPRWELLLLTLVALGALTVVQPPNVQDVSRLCLSKAILHGNLYADRCLSEMGDRSRYGGHLYSDKAPAWSVVAIAPTEAIRLPPPNTSSWDDRGDAKLWFVHLVTSGLAFLLCVFLVGRISEGLAPGYGGVAAVVLALGTELGALGISAFDHVLTGTLAFVAFVLATRRRPGAAGLAAGAALTTEYQATALVVIVLAYVGLLGLRPVGRYIAGALPGVVLLGAYDWAAFGAPWHPSYHYLANGLRPEQQEGLLGIHLPTAHTADTALFGNRGLLLLAPVLVAAAVGLWLLWRTGRRAEALVCMVVSFLFVFADAGYFDPIGGYAPAPRFVGPALPFLALGLGPVFKRWPTVSTMLAIPSVIASTVMSLTWSTLTHYRETVWGEIERLRVDAGRSRLARNLDRNILLFHENRIAGAVLVSLCCAAAFVLALVAAKRPRDA